MNDLVNVKGLSELQRLLDTLPAKIEKNIMRGALRAGLQPIREAAKQNINSVSGLLAASLDARQAVSVNARAGVVTAKLRAGTGFGQSGAPPGNLPIWVEYGTRPHLVKVRPEDRPSRMTRRGRRDFSIRTINRMVARGSLQIGGQFVGESVAHPGAQPRPFMRPALDLNAGAAVVAAGEYVKQRLATKHGLDTSSIDIQEGSE